MKYIASLSFGKDSLAQIILIKRLAEYNKEYGTAHEAVFKAKNDPKSS